MKKQISMVRYENGILVGVAHGKYKPADVAMFIRDGYQNVSEEEARKADSELVQRLKNAIAQSEVIF